MDAPDDLYTLRAQYWLGHYEMALTEARSVARRPMPQPLKDEREELTVRCRLAAGDAAGALEEAGRCRPTPAMAALGALCRYEADGNGDGLADALRALLAAPDSGGGEMEALRLHAGSAFLRAGMAREALQCCAAGPGGGSAPSPRALERTALALRVYLSIDRIDLAAGAMETLRSLDEDSVLVQLCAAQLGTVRGSATAPDALHHLSSLSEQYGPSLLLLNAVACAHLAAGSYGDASAALAEARQDHGGDRDADTLVNSVACAQHLGAAAADGALPLLAALRANHPTHPYVEGLGRVEAALDREAAKYRLTGVADA
jgi:coatomer protein complex subunit epsilon